jgi:nicotinic acetylcholine receptor
LAYSRLLYLSVKQTKCAKLTLCSAEAGFDAPHSLAVVLHSGVVYYVPKARIRTKCEIDLSQFPYDTQTCLLKFGSYTYDGFRLNLTKFYEKAESFDLGDYSLNKEWAVVSSSAEIITKHYSCCPEPYLHLECRLTVRRNTVYYTHIFVLPAILLALLVPFQFLLLPDSKERLTLGETVDRMLNIV